MKFLIYKTSDYKMVKKDYSHEFKVYKYCNESFLYGGSDETFLYYVETESIKDIFNLTHIPILLLKEHHWYIEDFLTEEDKQFFDGIIEIYDAWREY